MPDIDPSDRYPARNLPGEAEQWGRTLENDVVKLKRSYESLNNSLAGLNRSVASALSLSVEDDAARALTNLSSPLYNITTRVIRNEVPLTISDTEPEEPENETLWWDTKRNMLSRYRASDETWLPLGEVDTTAGEGPPGALLFGAATSLPEWGMDAIGIGDIAGIADGSDYSIVVGSGSSVSGGVSVVIGREAEAGTQGVAVGYGAKCLYFGGISLGYYAMANNGGVALGYQAESTGNNGYALGYYAKAQGYNTVALGANANASEYDAVAIGDSSEASGYNSIAAGGFGAKALEYQASAFGSYAEAHETGTVAVGSNSLADAYYGIAVGPDAEVQAGHEQGVAIGGSAKAIPAASGDPSGYGVAVGSGAQATGYGTAVGTGTSASAPYSTAIGSYGAGASAENAIALGNWAKADHEKSVAIGNNVTTETDRQAIIGVDELKVQGQGQYDDPGNGSSLVLQSPNGNYWRISVDNTGALSTTAV